MNNNSFRVAVRAKYAFKDRVKVATPLYMPPERLKKNYDSCKSDFFSLGVMLYKMLVGRTPWEVDNEKELVERMNHRLLCRSISKWQDLGVYRPVLPDERK